MLILGGEALIWSGIFAERSDVAHKPMAFAMAIILFAIGTPLLCVLAYSKVGFAKEK